MNYKVRFWDSDHGQRVLDNYVQVLSAHIWPYERLS
jgi:hypothetical protein